MFSARLAAGAFRERKEDDITPLRFVSSPLDGLGCISNSGDGKRPAPQGMMLG
jgi:hypothetical protein